VRKKLLTSSPAQVVIPPVGLFGVSATCNKTRDLPLASSVNSLTPDYVVFNAGLHMHTIGRRIWSVGRQTFEGSVVCRALVLFFSSLMRVDSPLGLLTLSLSQAALFPPSLLLPTTLQD
jgi:hypothetical protein